MKVSTLIQQLQTLYESTGNVDVLVTDGYNCMCYNGDYAIAEYEDENGTIFIDIGVGGNLE